MQREPSQTNRQHRESTQAEYNLQICGRTGAGPGRGKRQQYDRPENIKKAQDKAERAAESAHNFARIVLPKVGVKSAEPDSKTSQREGHDCDRQCKVGNSM